MPNWCSNKVTFYTEDPEREQAIIRELEEKKFSDKFRGYVSDWGKLDVGIVVVYFYSAWQPPTEIYQEYLSDHCEVEAYFFESGMMFCGSYLNGVEESFDICSADVGWIEENIPSEIVDNMDIIEFFSDSE